MNLLQRIANAMETCTYVQKDTSVSGYGGGYKAVSHDAVTAKVRSALLGVGVIATSSVISVERSREEIQGKNGARTVFRTSVLMETIFRNIDDPGDTITVQSVGTGEDSGDKADGKAVSYAAKYALLKALMLETGEDADKDASIQREAEQAAVSAAMEECKQLGADLKAIDPDGAEKIKNAYKRGAGYDWKGMRTALLAAIGHIEEQAMSASEEES